MSRGNPYSATTRFVIVLVPGTGGNGEPSVLNTVSFRSDIKIHLRTCKTLSHRKGDT